MEIEAKYTVLDPGTLVTLAALPSLAGYPIADIDTRRITDTYLDTPSQDLMANGYACRRRRNGDQSRIDLKGLGSQDGAIHRREELAVTIDASAMTDPELWPASRAREVTRSLSDGTALEPLFELTQKRKIRYLLNDAHEGIAELSIDTVDLSVAKWRQTFTEVEVELLTRGDESQFARIVAALTEFPGLVPQPTSKFERGLAMAYHVAGVGGALALGSVQPNDTVSEATRKLIRPLFLRMQLHESGTYRGEDLEELHDMRVMTRRMRTAFRIAEPYVDLTALAQVRKDLRKTARILGSVRDMDVFRQKTEAYLAENKVDRDQLLPLIRVWDGEYARRRNQMLAYLNSKRYGRFKQAFWAHLDTHLTHATTATTVRDALPLIVNQQLETLLVQGTLIGLPDAPLTAYHQLRIDVKYLRYTLRFFKDVLGPDVKRALSELEALQDIFGDLQDAVVAVDHLRAVIEHGMWDMPIQAKTSWYASVGASAPTSKVPKGLTKYLRAREAEITTLVAKACAAWEHFHEADTPQKVRDALVALQQ